MLDVESFLRSRGGFGRRCDVRARGFTDTAIRAALADHRIFRVRHGWYAVPDADDAAVRAVRLGGRLTGIAALETYGLRVPRRAKVDIVVPAGACRLRSPANRAARLADSDPVIVHWTDAPRRTLGSTSWRAPVGEALVVILRTENRDVAVACCSAVMHDLNWPDEWMDAVFARVPRRVRSWRALVNRLDGSHGETFVRLWLGDVGIEVESQPHLAGVGWLDFRPTMSRNVYIEVDGAQHDPDWTGTGESNWQKDHERDTTVAIGGGQVLRWTYLQLYRDWHRCIAALLRACADDLELEVRRMRHPSPPRALARLARTRKSRSVNGNHGAQWSRAP
jgi:very-short-patch-repair endonuclease